jgi:hypothetical protein
MLSGDLPLLLGAARVQFVDWSTEADAMSLKLYGLAKLLVCSVNVVEPTEYAIISRKPNTVKCR